MRRSALATPLDLKYRLTCSPAWTRTKNRPINSRKLCQLSYRGLPDRVSLYREPRHDFSLRVGVKAKPYARRIARLQATKTVNIAVVA